MHEPDRLWLQTSSRNRNWSLFVRLSTVFPLFLSLHFGAFPGSSLGLSNHSVTVTRRRFFFVFFFLHPPSLLGQALTTIRCFWFLQTATVCLWRRRRLMCPILPAIVWNSQFESDECSYWNTPHHIPQWRIGFLLPLPFRSAAPWPSACDALSHVTNWHFTWQSQTHNKFPHTLLTYSTRAYFRRFTSLPVWHQNAGHLSVREPLFSLAWTQPHNEWTSESPCG